MLLLSVDTSGRQGGITLARGDSKAFEVIESSPIEGGTFSAELIPQISELLQRHQLAAKNLEGLIAVTGPGSFTGLRVGLTAVKGLAEVLRIPIAAVTSLEILIAASAVSDAVLAVLDAGRREVYCAVQENGKREELVLPVTEAADLAKSRRLTVVAQDAGLATAFENSKVVVYCSSEVAARVGLKKLLSGETTDVLALDANYLRKPETNPSQSQAMK